MVMVMDFEMAGGGGFRVEREDAHCLHMDGCSLCYCHYGGGESADPQLLGISLALELWFLSLLAYASPFPSRRNLLNGCTNTSRGTDQDTCDGIPVVVV